MRTPTTPPSSVKNGRRSAKLRRGGTSDDDGSDDGENDPNAMNAWRDGRSDGAVDAAPEPAPAPPRARRGDDDGAPAPAPEVASPPETPRRERRGRDDDGAATPWSPRSPTPPPAPSETAASPGPGQKRGRGRGAAPAPTPDDGYETDDSDDNVDDDPTAAPPPEPREFHNAKDKKYWTRLRRLKPVQTKPTREMKQTLNRVEAIHWEHLDTFGIKNNWGGFRIPCVAAEQIGMGDKVDRRVRRTFDKAKRLPPERRVAYLERELLDSPGGPGRDLLRHIYRCPRPLTDKQYQKARPLWKVDLVLDPVEFVIEAVVLRPYELWKRWKHRRRRAEIKRYHGHKRVQWVTNAMHRKSEEYQDAEGAGF